EGRGAKVTVSDIMRSYWRWKRETSTRSASPWEAVGDQPTGEITMGKTHISRSERPRNIRRTRNVVRILIAPLVVSVIAGEGSAADVGTFLSKCKWMQDVAAGEKKTTTPDETKNCF